MVSASSKRPLYENYTPKFRKPVPIMLTIFFFMLAFVFGLDLGFTKYLKKAIRGVAKVITVTVSLVIILILAAPLNMHTQDWYWIVISFLTYLLCFLIISCSKCRAYEFLLDIHKIDDNILNGNKLKISVCVWLYSFILYSSKWVNQYFVCEVLYPEMCDIDFIPYLVYCIPAFGVDLIYVALILIYCCIYYSIKDIHMLYKKDHSLVLLKKRCFAVAKCYDKVRTFYEKISIVLLLMNLPRLMGLQYNSVKYFVAADLAGGFSGYLYCFLVMSNITASGAMVQMVVWQVDALILCLLDELVHEQDTKRREQRIDVVEYLKTRKLYYPLVGVVPVDMGLPAFVLSVCSTYLIVMIQFTHLID